VSPWIAFGRGIGERGKPVDAWERRYLSVGAGRCELPTAAAKSRESITNNRRSSAMYYREPELNDFLNLCDECLSDFMLNVAAFAWAGYQKEGHGAVLITVDDESDQRKSVSYLPTTFAENSGKNWPPPELMVEFETYDPCIEFIVLIDSAAHQAMPVFLLDWDPAPPDAFEMLTRPREPATPTRAVEMLH
jgi:hypothetical protein